MEKECDVDGVTLLKLDPALAVATRRGMVTVAVMPSDHFLVSSSKLKALRIRTRSRKVLAGSKRLQFYKFLAFRRAMSTRSWGRQAVSATAITSLPGTLQGSLGRHNTRNGRRKIGRLQFVNKNSRRSKCVKQTFSVQWPIR
jgi:hypothetical protein